MKIVAKDRTEQVIGVGDLVVERNLDIICWVGSGVGEGEFPYPLIDIHTGLIIDCYNNLDSVRRNCILLAKNKDITLTY